jgi:hypothetical protein
MTVYSMSEWKWRVLLFTVLCGQLCCFGASRSCDATEQFPILCYFVWVVVLLWSSYDGDLPLAVGTGLFWLWATCVCNIGLFMWMLLQLRCISECFCTAPDLVSFCDVRLARTVFRKVKTLLEGSFFRRAVIFRLAKTLWERQKYF